MGEQRAESLGELGPQTPPGQVIPYVLRGVLSWFCHVSEREEHGGEETVCEKDLNKFGFVMFGELWDCLAYVNTMCVCVSGRLPVMETGRAAGVRSRRRALQSPGRERAHRVTSSALQQTIPSTKRRTNSRCE